MYAHSDGGYRQAPGLVEFTQYLEPVSNDDYVVLSELTECISHTFNENGTKFCALDVSGTGYMYNAVNYVPTTYTGESYDFTTEDATPVAILFRHDTSILYMLGATTVEYHAYSISGSGEISDAALSVSIPSLSGTLTDFHTTNGTDWYFVTTSTYYQTSSNYEAALTNQSSDSLDLRAIKSTGTMFIDENLIEYRLTTAFDLSTKIKIGLTSSLLPASASRPSGTVTNRVYDFPTDSTVSMTGTLGGNVFFESSTTSGSLVDDGDFRGGEVQAGVPYIILGGSLLEFDSSGNFIGHSNGRSSAGIDGTGRAILDTDGTNLVITTGLNQYQFTQAAGWAEITDADLGDAYSNAYLDSTFYYEIGGFIYASDVDDPDSVEPLNFINAESFTDDITCVFALNQLLYAFGLSTIEVYFTSGAGNTRLSRQAVLEHGIIGRYAIDSIDDTIYFVDAERRLSRMRGLEYAPIEIPALGKEFNSYATVDDCIVNAYSFEQENFIDITFPTADVTWAVVERSGEVIKREDSTGSRARASKYLNVFGKTLAVDRSNGKIYEYSASTYQDDGLALNRTLFSQPVTSEPLGHADREFTLNSMTIEYDVSGSTVFTVELSKDSGTTFTQSRTITVTGRGTTKLPGWGMATEAIVKISTSSNTRADVLGLSVEAEMLDD